jgi:hypothetical protein
LKTDSLTGHESKTDSVKKKEKVFNNVESSAPIDSQAKPETKSSDGCDEEAATNPEN